MSKNVKRTIDYTNYDFDALRDDFVTQLQESKVFKDINIKGSNISTLTDLIAYTGSLFGYYINSAANEVFVPTAKRYNNLNKIGHLLKYDARGVVSATVDTIGSLTPEYVYGKEGEYIEIPSYSIFPSSKPTKKGENFIFTNIIPVNYIVKGFGIRPLEATDIFYKGYKLPFVANKSFFLENGIANPPTLNSENLTIPLDLYNNLSVIQRNDPIKYRPFDTTNFPLSNPSDSTSKGQPFDTTINGLQFTSNLIVGTEYSVLLKYDVSLSEPFLEVVTDPQILIDRSDDIIGKIILEVYDSVLETYRVRFTEIVTRNRFYIGKTGQSNLSSVSVTYDKIPGTTTSIERINLIINQDGNQPAYTVLINGKYFVFTSGTISSSKFKEDFFDSGVDYYNVNLTINNTLTPETNYEAYLDVSTKDPISNQVTIARIYTKFTDQDSGTSTFTSSPGKKYGNIQMVEKNLFKTTDQKAGRIYFKSGETLHRVLFSTVFVPGVGETQADYHVELSSESNVRKWYSNKTDTGFDIYVEPDTQFEGYISWVATRIITQNVKAVSVPFETPIPQVVTVQGSGSNYMVMLTPNANIEVWYENVTKNGFDIKTEKDFEGKVSWSVYNFFDDQSFPSDVESVYRQTGQVVIPFDSEDGIDVKLEVPFQNTGYAIQLVANKNINVFYSDKTNGGFKVKREPGVTSDIIVEWYVDGTTNYQFQRHGEVEFSGRSVISQQIPGLRFIDVAETFDIPGLMQGNVGFSYVNVNTVIDPLNNFLKMSIDPTRIYEKSVSFILDNSKISTNSLRIFIRNTSGIWDEWERFGTGYDVNNQPGSKVFSVRVNPDKKTKIEFGDGTNWGTSIQGKEVFIIGLESVGSDGNIGKNILSKEVTISQYILGNDRTDIDFEKSLVSIIGLKSKLIFEGSTPTTSILDSEGTVLNSKTDIKIVQNMLAIGGADVETVDELRSNVTNSIVRQNRNVSTNDTERYLNEVFPRYIVTSKVLTYQDIKAASLIPESELSKYWFNHVFVVALNKDGTNVISKTLRDTIVNNLNASISKMIGKEHEVIPASWIPIDVLIKYKRNKNGNNSTIETEMRKNIVDYFTPSNHILGDVLYHSDFVAMCKVTGVDEVEVLMNKDPGNKFTANDYNVSIRNTGETDQVAQRNKLMELVRKDPSLVRIFQPLFDTLKTEGTREWNYSLDIQLSEFEFPELGDIIIERA